MEPSYKYILLSNDSGERLALQEAPAGWDATKFNLIRDLVYIGILKTISVEFNFVGDGFRFVQQHRMKYGIDADIIIRLYRNNPNQFVFEGKINFENYVEDRKYNRFRVDIIQSGFVQKFKSREDVVLNVLNTIGLDQQPVTPAFLKNALFRGKEIQYISTGGQAIPEGVHQYHHVIPFTFDSDGNPCVEQAIGVQTENDDEDFENNDYPHLPIGFGANEACIFINRFNTPQQVVFTFDIGVDINYLGIGSLGVVQQRVIRLVLVDNLGNVSGAALFEYFQDDVAGESGHLDLADTVNVTVPVGYKLVFVNEMRARLIGDPATQGFLTGFDLLTAFNTEYTYTRLDINITVPSSILDASHPVILPHELFSNLIAQINGGEFYSEFFGREDLGYDADGEGAYLAITTGELLRGIAPEGVMDGVPYKLQVPTSMREAFSSYSSVFCLGAIISQNRIQVEKLDDLFNSNIIADIGEVSSFSISPAKDFLFNSVKCGYPVNEYEQENGRDEFNTTYQYTNSLKVVKKELDLVSKYYGDGYGIEFARRESIVNTGTKDTKYDSKIFLIDLIKDGDDFVTRRQEDILFVQGIFSPETAMNLRIAAGQNMLRWRKYLNIPLDKKDKVYFFQSKDKNTSLNLVTELGETIDGQNLNTGAAALFKPEERSFERAVTVDLLFAILNNPLGIVRYTHNGEKFFDYLLEVNAETEKGKGSWRVLGTKDSPVQTAINAEAAAVLKYGDGLTDYVKYADGPEDFILYQ